MSKSNTKIEREWVAKWLLCAYSILESEKSKGKQATLPLINLLKPLPIVELLNGSFTSCNDAPISLFVFFLVFN